MALCTLKILSAGEIARSKPNRSPPWQNCKLENDTNTRTHRSRVVVIHTQWILACASLHDCPLSEETGSLVLPQWRRWDNLFSHKGDDRITCSPLGRGLDNLFSHKGDDRLIYSLGRGLDNLFFPEEGDWITCSPIRQETGSLVLL